MIDLNDSYTAVLIIAFGFWAFTFVFCAGNDKAVKPFLLLMLAWLILGAGKLIMDGLEYRLPTFEYLSGLDTGSSTLLSGVIGVLFVSLVVGLYRTFHREKKVASTGEESPSSA